MLDNVPNPNSESEEIFTPEEKQLAAKKLNTVVSSAILAWRVFPTKDFEDGIIRMARFMRMVDATMAIAPPIFAFGLLTRLFELEAELATLKAQQTIATATPKPAPSTDDLHINVPPLAVN